MWTCGCARTASARRSWTRPGSTGRRRTTSRSLEMAQTWPLCRSTDAKMRIVDSIRGQLLIAGPGLGDPNFWRTVVLVVEHNAEGALGLVLNRPSETTVGEAVPELQEL